MAIPASDHHLDFGCNAHFDDTSADDVEALDRCVAVGTRVEFGGCPCLLHQVKHASCCIEYHVALLCVSSVRYKLPCVSRSAI